MVSKEEKNFSEGTLMKEIYIIDMMSQVYRAYYAIRGLSKSDGFPTGAIYGFITMLNTVIKKYDPEYLALIKDAEAPTFRHKEYKEYKATRKPMEEDLVKQLPIILEFCKAYNIPVIEVEGFEADDIIAKVAKLCEKNNIKLYIISSDKDLYQLVSDNVVILDTKYEKIYTPEEVEKKFGVKPEQIVDFLSLVGDSSDNIPGAPGIGIKTAAKLLNEYSTLENLLANTDKIKREKIKNSLKENKEQILFSKGLVKLNFNIPIEIDLENFKRKEPDLKKLKELFLEYEFKSLLKEIEGLNIEEEKELKIKWGDKKDLATLKENEEIFIFTVSNKKGPISFFIENRGAIYHLEKDEYYKIPKMCRKIFYRSKFKGNKNLNNFEDLKLMHYLLHPDEEDHSIDRMIISLLNRYVFTEEEFKKREKLPEIKEEKFENFKRFFGERTYLLKEIYPILKGKIKNKKLTEVYENIEKPLVEVLSHIENTGIKLDTKKCNEISKELEIRIETLKKEIYELAEEEFNINSPKQLGVILFEKLNLPVIKKTKKTKSYGTGVDVLEELSLYHPLPQKILDYRQLQKLKSTYIDPLPDYIDPKDGRLHTILHQTVTSTGRLSSSDPNLQNIPIRTDEGKKIRELFIAEKGFKILSFDYSQIELRILAHLTEDENLINSFLKDRDIHLDTATKIFGLEALQNPREFRRRAKAINYGIIYGLSEFGLAKDLKISKKDAKKIIDAYFEKFPKIRKWIEENALKAKETGYVKTLFGRIRPIPQLKSSNKNLQKLGIRLATNSPIQGTAADIIKMAMIEVYNLIKKRKNWKMVLQIHDELLLEIPENETSECIELVKEIMENVVKLKVHLKVDAGSGKNWLEAK